MLFRSRQGNNWSFKHARRQWSLRDNGFLKYQWLGEFDAALMNIIQTINNLNIDHLTVHQDDRTISFMRGDYLFICNLSPATSYNHYKVPATAGSYRIILDSDSKEFGGHGRIQQDQQYFTTPGPHGDNVRVYLPARSGLVLCRID